MNEAEEREEGIRVRWFAIHQTSGQLTLVRSFISSSKALPSISGDPKASNSFDLVSSWSQGVGIVHSINLRLWVGASDCPCRPMSNLFGILLVNVFPPRIVVVLLSAALILPWKTDPLYRKAFSKPIDYLAVQPTS